MVYFCYMSQVHLLTGENNYALMEVVRTWKQQFIQKHGADNLLEVSAKSVQIVELIQEVSTLPFLAEKRLVIIDGIPKIDEQQLEQFLQSIHPEVIVLFIAPKLDKRLKVQKILLNKAEVQTFETLKGAALKKWFTDQAAQLGVQFTTGAAEYCLQKIGSNQGLLAMELEKLALYNSAITESVIDMFCVTSTEQEMWGLMSCLARKDATKGIAYIERLHHQGESAIGIWSIYVWMMAQLQLMVGAIRDGANSASFMKEYKVSFGPAKQFGSLATALAAKKSTAVFKQIAQYETALKTGGLQATVDQEQEVLAALEVSIITVCSA